MTQDAGRAETVALPQGDLRLLESESVTEVDGNPQEYAMAARRYLGEEAAAGYQAQIDQPGTRMARIGVRPAWVGVIDFETRLPVSLGGVTGRERRG